MAISGSVSINVGISGSSDPSGSINLLDEIDLSKVLGMLGIELPAVNIPSLPESGSLPKVPEPPKKIKLIPVTGVVVNIKTNEPLKGVKVVSLLKTSRTNDKGEFEIKIPSILDTGIEPTKFPLNFIKLKYAPLKYIPYTSTGDVKPSLGIIGLNPAESNLKQEIIDLLSLKDAQVEDYATTDITFEFTIQKKLNLSIDELKKTVIPLILGLVAQYGLTKIQELVEENKNQLTESLKALIVCPPKEDLAKIIATKNKLTHQLNKILNTITKASDTISIADTTISTIDGAYQILKFLPTPSAVAGVGIPVSVINAVQDVKTFLNNNIGKLKQGSGGIASILKILVSILEQVLAFLNLLDKITQFCSQGSDITQEQISAELTALTQQQTQQLSPIVINANGFEMGVETEPTTNSLKRRRAIARNKGGVVMLTGEWSYSSVDQILIDELVFYIQQNNLKAD
jgi:hypothetical protein